MVERQTRDLEVQVQIPVQVQILLLKFTKIIYYKKTKLSINVKNSNYPYSGKKIHPPSSNKPESHPIEQV